MNDVRQTDNTPAPPDAASGSPGTILRRCREFHDITLDEAAEATKIGISHLRALEDDQIREFANQAYLKGFLRIYATYLGLNADDIARMYDRLFGSSAEKAPATRRPGGTSPTAKRLFPFRKLLFPALLLAVILITATFFKRPPAPLVRQPYPVAAVAPPAPQNSAVQMAASSAKKQKPAPATPPSTVVTAQADQPETEKPAPAKRPPEAPKGFILKIRVVQNGTLTAAVDDNAPQQYVLTSGDIFEWKAEKSVALDLSNGGGVDVELNGRPYKPLGPPGKPVYVELDADGVRH